MMGNKEMFREGDSHLNYLRATQGATVRLDLVNTPLNIEGLCTDGLSACLCIIVLSKNLQKMSLTHTDLAVSTDALLAECAWVGSSCTLYIIKGMEYGRHLPQINCLASFNDYTLPRLKKAIQSSSLDIELDVQSYDLSAVWWACISRSGEIILPTPDQNTSLYRVGHTIESYIEVDFRHTINTLNHNVLGEKGQYHALDVQFDGEKTTPFPVLNEEASNQVKKHREKIFSHNNYIYQTIIDYLKHKKNYIQLIISLNREGLEFYKEGKYEEAIDHFNQAILISTSLECYLRKAAVLFNRGSAYMKSQHFREAVLDLEACYSLRKEKGAEPNLLKKTGERLTLFRVREQENTVINYHEFDRFFIHVPQGRAARLSTRSPDKISGLYTGGFTNCNLIVILNSDNSRCSLVHADFMCNELIVQKEYDWVSKLSPARMLVFYRKGYKGSLINSQKWENFSAEKQIDLKLIAVDILGIHLSLKQIEINEFNEPNLAVYQNESLPPNNLIRHPDEERFLAIDKIEQLTNQVNEKYGFTPPLKEAVVFSENHWTVIPPSEFQPLNKFKEQKNLIKLLSENSQNIVMISSALNKGYEYLAELAGNYTFFSSMQSIVSDIAFYASGYFHNFDAKEIIKGEIKGYIECDPTQFAPKSKEDIEFKSALSAILNSDYQIFEIVEAIDALLVEVNTESSEYKKQFRDEYLETYKPHYFDRKVYEDLRNYYVSERKRAVEWATLGSKAFNEKNFLEALQYFREAWDLIALCIKRNDSLWFNLATRLSTVLLSLSRNCIKTSELGQAEIYLDQSEKYYKTAKTLNMLLPLGATQKTKEETEKRKENLNRLKDRVQLVKNKLEEEHNQVSSNLSKTIE